MSERSSVWMATTQRPGFEPLDGDVHVDVAVIGGGVTGLTAALMLQRDGARVALIEARRIGDGTSGGTTGKVTSQHGIILHELIRHHGEDRARRYAEANQAAIDVVEALCDDTGVDCGFRRAPAYAYTIDPERVGALVDERRAAVQLGITASLTTDTDLPFAVELALRFDHQAHIHIGAYMAGLAGLLAEAGGVVHEETRATGIAENADHAVVETERGRIRCDAVVMATLLPFADRGGFFAKARPMRSYGVAVRLDDAAPEGMHLDIGSPTRSTRPWDDDGRPGLIVVGEGHDVGDSEATPGRWGRLEEWARTHFDVASFAHRWSAQDYSTADRVPYVGRSPRMQRTLVATGFGKWGLTNATVAARILADLVAGRDNPHHEVFDATRIGDAATVGRIIEDNLGVAVSFVTDRISRIAAGSLDGLGCGEADLVRIDGQTVAAHRDPSGRVHAVSATCPHLGCTVAWNAAENSWDCPCHGSRFSLDGTVLNAPAVRGLDGVDVEDT